MQPIGTIYMDANNHGDGLIYCPNQDTCRGKRALFTIMLELQDRHKTGRMILLLTAHTMGTKGNDLI